MDDITQSRFPNSLKDQFIVFLVCCMAWLIPAHAVAATDTYYFQHTVAGARVCGGDVTPTWTTPIYSQSVTGEANILPTGGSITSNTGFPGYESTLIAKLMNWDPGTGSTGIGMYSVPYAVPMTIASISLRLSYAIINETIQSKPGFARFYDVDGNAACSDGILIGQTPDLVFPFSKVTLNLSGLLYNIQPGHRIRVELWHYNAGTGGASGAGSMSITYGTGTDSGLIIDQTPTPADTCTVGPGAVLPDTVLLPGGPETALNTFTLETSAGTDSIKNVVVRLSPTASSSFIGSISIKSDDGSITYGTVSNPSSEQLTIPLSTNITVTTTPVQYKIMITPKTAAAMPAPGASRAVQGYVTRLDSFYTKVYNDTPSATVTIDNIVAGTPAWGRITPEDSSITLRWINPDSANFQSVLVLRGTASTAPVNGSSYAVGSTLGGGKVIYAGNLQTFTDGLVTGDALYNGTSYSYQIFAKNVDGSYSPGSTAGPFTPVQIGPGTAVVGNGIDPPSVAAAVSGYFYDLDAFTVTSKPYANLKSVAFTFAPGTAQYMSRLLLTNDTGSVTYATVDYPFSDSAPAVFTGLNLPITDIATPFKVRINPHYANQPPVG